MKKNLLCFAASWLLLIGALAALLVTTRELDVTLDAPAVAAETGAGGVTLTWQPVAYATSYRVYSRDSGGQWALVKAVGKDDRSCTVADAAREGVRPAGLQRLRRQDHPQRVLRSRQGLRHDTEPNQSTDIGGEYFERTENGTAGRAGHRAAGVRRQSGLFL